ncbi:MAG: superoxide dismutase family protein [Janthinobacterium lividum]
MLKAWIGTAGLLAGCIAAGAATAKPVTVPMTDATGANVGTVTFSQHGKNLELRASLKGLPAGEHAIHVHAVGTCTPPDFSSAGGHYNPESKHHGFSNPEGHHAGDFPASVTIKADGKGSAKLSNSDLSLDKASMNSVYGKSVVVHELVDDQKTDPAGASGKRIACGVIPAAPSM